VRAVEVRHRGSYLGMVWTVLAPLLMLTVYSVVFGVMRGVKVRVAHAVGAGRPEDGVRYAQAGVAIAALGLAVIAFPQLLLAIAGGSPAPAGGSM